MLKSRSQDKIHYLEIKQYADEKYSVIETVLGRLCLDPECGFGQPGRVGKMEGQRVNGVQYVVKERAVKKIGQDWARWICCTRI